jgi:hypothetical protein
VPELPAAYVRHKLSGRLRIKIPSMKGDIAYMTSLVESFSKLPGIEKLSVSPATGSVLFIHSIDAEEISGYAQSHDLFSLSQSKPYPTNMHQRVTETFNSLNRHVVGMTDGEIDIAGMSFLVLIAAGVYQISRGNFIAVPWYAAFWYALNVFLKSSSGKGGD